MTIIVTDAGFGPDTGPDHYDSPNSVYGNNSKRLSVDLPSDFDLDTLQIPLARFAAIRIDFPSFADGRGMTIARRLRAMGFTGRLRARGHILADQYAMARRSGFDEIEIPDEIAVRQPERQWLGRADWQAGDYQKRLRG